MQPTMFLPTSFIYWIYIVAYLKWMCLWVAYTNKMQINNHKTAIKPIKTVKNYNNNKNKNRRMQSKRIVPPFNGFHASPSSTAHPDFEGLPEGWQNWGPIGELWVAKKLGILQKRLSSWISSNKAPLSIRPDIFAHLKISPSIFPLLVHSQAVRQTRF